MQNFKIFKKINYNQESSEKQFQLDQICEEVISKMTSLGYKEVLEHDENDKIDYVFSIGGDGTMLHAMQNHVTNNSIVIGINAGNLGFLTPFSIEEVFSGELFKIIRDKNYKIEKRSILKSNIKGLEDSAIAVNEISFYGNEVNSLFNFSMDIDYNGQSSKAGFYKANTLIISGPCGSTAYNMNAGGCIVDPTVRCMQILMLAPSTIVRPLIVGKNSNITIKFTHDSKVFIDGSHYKNLKEGDELSVSLVQEEVEVLLPSNWNFYSVLSKKLHWNNGRDV